MGGLYNTHLGMRSFDLSPLDGIVVQKHDGISQNIRLGHRLSDRLRLWTPTYFADGEIFHPNRLGKKLRPDFLNSSFVVLAHNGQDNASVFQKDQRFGKTDGPPFQAGGVDIFPFRHHASPHRVIKIDAKHLHPISSAQCPV